VKSATLKAESPRQGQLHATDAKQFLAQYKKAWETRDAELAAGLFTRDAEYHENPFSAPIVSREAIHDYWEAATREQEDIQFTVRNFLYSGYTLMAEWTCTFRDRSTGERKELAGAFFADFYGRQVRTFREYWASRKL
jgi:hypothetical protein